MLTLLAPLLLLQTPHPQVEIRIEKSIESGSPAACCSQSKGQAKGGGTPKKARSLKQAWREHQNSGKSLGVQDRKSTAKSLVPLNASFGWTTQPSNHGGNGPIMRGKAIIMDDSGQQRVIEFDGDFPDIQGFLPAGVQLPNLGELIGKGCDNAQGCSSVAKGCDKAQGCSSVAKGCDKAQGCSTAAKSCDKAQGCPFQNAKSGKTDGPQRLHESHDRERGHGDWDGEDELEEAHNRIGELEKQIAHMERGHGDWDEEDKLEEAHNRIDELEEQIAHMERVLKHISDELIHAQDR